MWTAPKLACSMVLVLIAWSKCNYATIQFIFCVFVTVQHFVFFVCVSFDHFIA